MKYCKEYIALFLLVVAVVIVGPLVDAIHDFSAITGGEKKRPGKDLGQKTAFLPGNIRVR